MIDEHLLAEILVVQPELPVGPEEEVDGRVPGQGVQRRLAEAGDHGALPLDGHDAREQALGGVHGRVVDLRGVSVVYSTGLIMLQVRVSFSHHV